MSDTIQIILFFLAVMVYIIMGILIIVFVANGIKNINPYLRLTVISFLIALFFGLSAAASGGDPGFAIPAPNVLALLLMGLNGNNTGVLNGLFIFCFWWVIIFLFKLAKYSNDKKHQSPI